MAVNLSTTDKSQISAKYDTPQSSDWQYKNFNLNKLHESLQSVQVQNNASRKLFTKSSSKFSWETKNCDQSFREKNDHFVNEKWRKSFMDTKVTKLSSFGGNRDQSKIQSTNVSTSSKNSSTLSLHIAAYENSVSNLKESEDEFSNEKNNKNMISKKWKTVKQFFGNTDTTKIFEIPRQQKEDTTEPEIMQFKASQQLLDPNQLAPKNPFTTVSNTEILERGTEIDGEKVELPEKELVEEVSFLFNNLSTSNIPNKVDDLRKLLDEHGDTFRKWLAQYLVMKRITLEPNFHVLYNSYLVALNDDTLDDFIREETLRNIRILLKSEKKSDAPSWSFDDRTLLKNLGKWLGLISLGRSQPLLFDELDMKGLLLDALEKGEQELLYVVPFVVKILESSELSGCFSPACAWVTQCLETLAIIYQQPNIKLAIKFEFEVLCQHLKVPLCYVLPPYSYLPHENFGSPEFYDPNVFSPRFGYEDINIYEPIDMHFDIPDELPLFQMFPTLPNIIRKAMATSVAENLDEMVIRASVASILLADVIINKDFIQCPDPHQMRRSYLYLVRSLTSAAGMVTTKEPLTTCIIGHLRSIIKHQIEDSGEYDKEFIRMADETMVYILENNIEYVCCYVVKTACEKAIIEMDKRMADAVHRRKRGKKFDISPEIKEILDKLPKELRPPTNALDDEKMAVYNIFGAEIVGFHITHIIDPSLLLPEEQQLPYYYREEQPVRHPLIPLNVFRKRSEIIFTEWTKFCAYSGVPPTQFVGAHLFGLMEKCGIPISESNVFTFLKLSLEICNDATYELISRQKDKSFTTFSFTRNNMCYTVDAFAKLVCFFVKSGNSGEKKLEMLTSSLEMISKALLHDHDMKSGTFTGLPMLRIFVTMIREFCHRKDVLFYHDEYHHGKFIETLGRALNTVQPRRAPAFAYHWLEIIGHRLILTYFLAPPHATHVTRAVYAHLLIGHLKFLAPCLRNVYLPPPVHALYMGTLRLMLLILHDVPEVFCEYYYVFCDAIPPNCIQLRNIVLCGYPCKMKLPDPYKQGFETIEALPVMNEIVDLSSKMFTNIPDECRLQLDQHPTEPSCVTQLIKSIKNGTAAGNKYNVPCLNAAVNYIGIQAITKIKESEKQISKLTVAESSYIKLYMALVNSFCTEGRYLLCNALANQLRYPNAQTHYFACVILYLFKEAATDATREQITRSLFERFLANRPHPWGLLFVYRELITNDEYKFWTYDFVHCSPEIEQSFMNVAKTWNVKVPSKFPEVSAKEKSKTKQ